jgi:type IV pilus assembly protein PilB
MADRHAEDILRRLVAGGSITQDQADEAAGAAAEADGDIASVLLAKRMTDAETVAKAEAGAVGLPYEDLGARELEPRILNLIPKNVAEEHGAVAFAQDGNVVSVGMVDPDNATKSQAVSYLLQASGNRPQFFAISRASLEQALRRYEALTKDVASALEVAKGKYESPTEEMATVEQELGEVIKGAPVSRIVAVMLRYAVEAGASDIHVEPYGEETRVRYRVDGVLRSMLALPKYLHASVVSRIKVLASMKLDETRVPQDGRITETIAGKLIDFRVSTLPLTDAEKVVMRVLDTTRGVPTLRDLGFREEYEEIIMREIRKPHGMFLITGPTGSGKSTTLFTVLSLRNEEGVNISTLENPVEYFIKGVNQAQIRPEVGFTFASGLRALLRQDPNIIMVGEIRDGETGELSIHAALTGHMLFSTMHTNNAMGVVPRMVDMRLEPFLIGATLNVAIAQRLARRVCDRCKAPTTVPPELEAKVRAQLAGIPARYRAVVDAQAPRLSFYKGRGCVRCNNTGYLGRVACAEILLFDERLRDLVVERAASSEIEAAARAAGFMTLGQDALLKALVGLTTMEEVLRVTAE